MISVIRDVVPTIETLLFASCYNYFKACILHFADCRTAPKAIIDIRSLANSAPNFRHNRASSPIENVPNTKTLL